MDNSNSNYYGSLRVWITEKGTTRPIKNAIIEILSSSSDMVLEQGSTDENGYTPVFSLPAPPREYSMAPEDNQPYAEYIIKVRAINYNDEIVTGVQIFPDEFAMSDIGLTLKTTPENVYNPIVIGPHTLWYEYPSKIPEDEIKPVNFSGEIVLRNVVIPETIVVHDGSPGDTTAKNYYVPYLEYIKNVASCEIYSTWPLATIQANVLAIMSFTLNRVYTEWYRNKGYNFTITSSTAFDQKWIFGKTLYESISDVVDSLYNNYLSRPNIKQPIFTQYCDGKRVTCPKWMSQWGSKYLGDDGLSAIEIIRYYYGDDMYINESSLVSGIPYSFPDTSLSVGSRGEDVLHLQSLLNGIKRGYPAIPALAEDGIYGQNTKNAVETFQRIFDLPVTGVVDYATWYKISQIYVGVTKIAEN